MGGTQARIQDFLKGGGGGEDIHKHPPLDIARVTSSTFQGGVISPGHLHRFSVSGQVQGGGGGVIIPVTPPGSATGTLYTGYGWAV